MILIIMKNEIFENWIQTCFRKIWARVFHMPNPKIHSPDDPNINIWGEGVGEEFHSQICL